MQKTKLRLAKIFSFVVVNLISLSMLRQKAFAEWDPLSAGAATGLPDATIYDIISNILDWLLTIVGIVGVIGFAIAGLMYLTAAGDDDQIKKAKKAMTYSIIGVIVAICGVVVLQAVDVMLNAQGVF